MIDESSSFTTTSRVILEVLKVAKTVKLAVFSSTIGSRKKIGRLDGLQKEDFYLFNCIDIDAKENQPPFTTPATRRWYMVSTTASAEQE